MGKHRVRAVTDGLCTARRLFRKAVQQGCSARQAEVEVEQRLEVPRLSLNLLLTLAEFFISLLSWLFDLWQGQKNNMCDMVLAPNRLLY